jgi:uncharacterized membrane protein YeaQ/YmgE (transglycosylase-associated protein family)
MEFITGFAIWIAVGLVAAFVARAGYRAPATAAPLTFAFGIFGAFIGGMLGTSPYIFHDPVPLRIGSLIGAVAGAFFFTLLYHFAAKRVV